MNKRAIAVIIAGFFTIFVAYAIRYSFGLLLPHMLTSLEISKTQAGVIYSSYFIAYSVFSPILGLLTDRYDNRVLLTLFVFILGIGAFLMSYSSSVINASLFFTIAGIGHSACWVPVVTLVQRWVSDRYRGTALAFTDLGSATGIIVWSMTMPLIVSGYSWMVGWKFLGISACVVAGLNYLDQLADKGPGESFWITYRKLFRDTSFWLIGMSYLLIGFSILIPFTFLSTYAVQELNMPYNIATGLIAVIAIAGVFGKLTLGHLSDIFDRTRLMMLCGALTAGGSLGIAYSQVFFTICIFTAVFGIGYGAIWAIYAAASRDYFPREISGSVIGLWTLVSCNRGLGN
ncbi:MAG: MFS transporter [Deltaproteobacteria bacterium]|nr:MFS transporter [Deltaproteobacteria bacterium]